MSKRQVAIGLLEKVGANYTPKISTDRASNKLRKYLEENGLPDDLTQDEVDFLEDEMGIEVSIVGAKPDGTPPNSSAGDPVVEKKDGPEPGLEPSRLKMVDVRVYDAIQKEEKKAKKEKTRKPSRGGFICNILANLPEDGMTLDEISKLANDKLVESGGKDNLKQTRHHARGLVGAAREWNIVKKVDGKIYPA